MEGKPPPAGYQLRIRDLPQGERPRERLRDYGPHFLSNAELLAILLRTGQPQKTWSTWPHGCLLPTVALQGWPRLRF